MSRTSRRAASPIRRRIQDLAERVPDAVLEHVSIGVRCRSALHCGIRRAVAACDCYTAVFMLKDTLEQGRIVTDEALERLLPAADQYPVVDPPGHAAQRFAGGKRLRPILCMEAAQMVEGCVPVGVEELGAALEMLHTYSLIHDDLPALDNDDLRRGRPTCHKAVRRGDGDSGRRCSANLRVRGAVEVAVFGAGASRDHRRNCACDRHDRRHDRRTGDGP